MHVSIGPLHSSINNRKNLRNDKKTSGNLKAFLPPASLDVVGWGGGVTFQSRHTGQMAAHFCIHFKNRHVLEQFLQRGRKKKEVNAIEGAVLCRVFHTSNSCFWKTQLTATLKGKSSIPPLVRCYPKSPRFFCPGTRPSVSFHRCTRDESQTPCSSKKKKEKLHFPFRWLKPVGVQMEQVDITAV